MPPLQPTCTCSGDDPPPRATVTPARLAARQDAAPTSTTTTTTTTGGGSSSSSKSAGGSSGGLGGLSWWQLLCITLAGVSLLGIALWVYLKHRRKTQENRSKALQLEREEVERAYAEKRAVEQEAEAAQRAGKRKKRSKGRRRRPDSSEDDSASASSASDTEYDSMSDGGTVRRRRRPRRRRYSSDDSDYSYDYERRRGRRRRERSARRGRRPYPPRRRSPSPSPTPTPTPTPPSKKSFRDSVFSTYDSMKKAAVRLKYVEQKVKLKKQLEAEERVEKSRQAKIKEANRELEEARLMSAAERERVESRRLEARRQDSAGSGSGRPLIPPARTPYTNSSLSSSTRSMTPRLPTPPVRAATRQPTRAAPRQPGHDQANAFRKVQPARPTKQPSKPEPHLSKQQAAQAQAMRDRQATQHRQPSHPPPGTGLDGEVNRLLGKGKKPTARPSAHATRRGGGSSDLVPEIPPVPEARLAPGPTTQPPAAPAMVDRVKQTFANAFQADWLSHPADNVPSVPQSVRTTVLVPMNNPRDRPMIPKGGLAPAPPPKARLTPLSGSGSGSAALGSGSSGANGGKWANRLRERR